jgi:hypothetical protein
MGEIPPGDTGGCDGTTVRRRVLPDIVLIATAESPDSTAALRTLSITFFDFLDPLRSINGVSE